MTREFEAREYQTIARDFMLTVPRCNLWAGMGLGKTVSTLNTLEALILTGTSDPTLVIGPLRVARDTWPTETRKWRHLSGLQVSPIVGSPGERRAALNRPAHIYTTNYEQIPWLVDYFSDRRWPFRNIVADEATKLKGHRLVGGGVRAKALGMVARQTDRWINLTGTPAPNGLKDLWGQLWFVDFGERLGRTHNGFVDRWFRQDHSGYGLVPFPHSEKEIYERIDDVTLSLRSEDWFDLEKPIVTDVRVPLPKAVRAQYRQLEKELFTQLLSGHGVEVFNSASLTNKCLQFANGAVYTDDKGNWQEVHTAKLEALESIVEELNGAPLLVSYQFVSDKERILKTFKGAVDVSTDEGERLFRARKAQIGVAHPKSMGHGIDGFQDVCHHLAYFGYTWDLELHDQILERIGPVRQLQAGLDRNVFVYRIVTDNTRDDTVLLRHETKRSVQELLMEAMAEQSA